MSERLLVVSPHADDAELGCGGYMVRVAAGGGRVRNVVVALGDTYFPRLARVVTAEERSLELSASMLVLGAEWRSCFADKESWLDTVALRDVIGKIEEQIAEFQPTEILIPLPSSHQDHVVVHQACVAATRVANANGHLRLIASYEYPATCWGPGAGANASAGGLYVELTEEALEWKLRALECHKSQIRKDGHCWSVTAARAMATMRGMEANMRYAELFHVMRQVRRA